MALFRQKITRWVDESGKRVPPGTPGAKKQTCRSRKWYADIPDGKGGKKRSPLSTNRSVAMQMLAERLRRAELASEGLPLPDLSERDRPLAELIADFGESLKSGKTGKRRRAPDERTVAQSLSQIARVLDGFALARDITLARVRETLAELQRSGTVPLTRETYTSGEAARVLRVSRKHILRMARQHRLPSMKVGRAHLFPRSTIQQIADRKRDIRGWGSRTAAFASIHLRRFTRWLVRRGVLPADPLHDLECGASEDHRHDRRPISPVEVVRVLDAARDSTRTVAGLTGKERWALYLVALSTGFRSGELGVIRPEHCRFSANPPVITLPQADSKNGKGATQPIPPAVAEALAGWIEARPRGKVLWPGSWSRRKLAAKILRVDLEAAGVPYVVEGPDGPLFADFHALRHTFVAMLDRAGVSLKQAMQLARHSDPRLTARIYGRAELSELGGAVARIAVTGMVTEMVTANSTTQGDTKRHEATKDDSGPAGHKGEKAAKQQQGSKKTGKNPAGTTRPKD